MGLDTDTKLVSSTVSCNEVKDAHWVFCNVSKRHVVLNFISGTQVVYCALQFLKTSQVRRRMLNESSGIKLMNPGGWNDSNFLSKPLTASTTAISDRVDKIGSTGVCLHAVHTSDLVSAGVTSSCERRPFLIETQDIQKWLRLAINSEQMM